MYSGGSFSNEVNKISPKKFFEYVSYGDVEKIDIINKREVKVYLTQEALTEDIHKNSVKANFPLSGRSANYKFETGDLQNFENGLARMSRDNDLSIGIEYIENYKSFKNTYKSFKNIINKNSEIIVSGLALVVIFFILATYYKRISALFERKKYIVFSICLLLLVLGVFYFQSQNSVINWSNFIIILILTFKNSKQKLSSSDSLSKN